MADILHKALDKGREYGKYRNGKDEEEDRSVDQIEMEELEAALQKTKNRKAPGQDNINPELLKFAHIESTSTFAPPPKKKFKKNPKKVQDADKTRTSTIKPESSPEKEIIKTEEVLPRKEPENVVEDNEEINWTGSYIPDVKTHHKLENVMHNDLFHIVIDEISLEGLDGITTEALWTRISDRTSESLPFSLDLKNTVWDIIIKNKDIKFHLLDEPRAKLVVYNRYKYVDWETGYVTEPNVLPEDIYPFAPILEEDSGDKCFGSCASFKYRANITGDIRQSTLQVAENNYGSKLIMVADQILRDQALGLQNAKSLNKLSNVHYCILERIGRARKLGEVTAGKNSLLQMSDSKSLFYLRKQLLANNLITKQQFVLRNARSGSISALLFHLTRFYTEHRSNKTIMMEQIIDLLKKKPDHRMEYLELKKIVGTDAWAKGVQKLVKSQEFRQYVNTDVLVPYRVMYPDALQKEWKVKNAAKEKQIRVLELINPSINLTVALKDDDAKDDSSDDEPLCNYSLNLSTYNQIYNLIYETGSEGMSLKRVQRILGLDFYVTRSMLTNMFKRNILETKTVDYGRLHILKYYIRSLHDQDGNSSIQNLQTSNEQKAREYADDDALSFIADVLEIDKSDLVPREENSVEEKEVPKENPFAGHFEFIKEYKSKNRIERLNKSERLLSDIADNKIDHLNKKVNTEERDKFEAIFKNDHEFYPMELSMRYKRVESMTDDVNVEGNFGDINLLTVGDDKSTIQVLSEFGMGDFNTKIEETFKNASLKCKARILMGDSKNASLITQKYLFLPMENIGIDRLINRFASILTDIREQIKLKSLEFPKEYLLYDEVYSKDEENDNMSLIINLEEFEDTIDEFKGVDDEIEEFKSHLIDNFETETVSLRYTNINVMLIEDSTDNKRKGDIIEDDVKKRIKLEPEIAENQNPKVLSDIDAILKKITDTYMAKTPVLVNHHLDEDNIETIVVTTPNYEIVEPTKKYVNNALSQRTQWRANFILDTVSREKIITDLPKLVNMIKCKEKERRLIGILDKKSIDRLLCHLVVAGYIKIYKIILKYENVTRCKSIICLPPLDIANTIQIFVDQMKIAFFIYAKRKTDIVKSTMVLETFSDSQTIDSYDEMVAMTSSVRRPKYKYSRLIARQYGYVPKFAKIKIIHEFLFYLIYGYDGQAVATKDVPKLLKQFHLKIDDQAMKEMGTIYKRELSWKMFLPPLPKYKEWPSGWALICDLILRLPLSIFVKIFNIAYIIPELIPLLNDPVKKHILLKNVPADIRNACLHNRKCIFSVHEILCHLCYMGLLQFGVQKVREKEQQYIYLNRRAILHDTTSSELGYHEITKKEYPILQFYFDGQTILDNYWSKLWNISMNTKLGQRYSMLLKTITLQDIHSKPGMIQAVIPKTPEDALTTDVGYIPGDSLGACCFDSSTWVHVKRNWIWSTSSKRCPRNETSAVAPILGMRKRHLEQIKAKPMKYKDLQREISKKKMKKPTQTDRKIEKKKSKREKKNFIIRKVLPRPSVKKMRTIKFDELDNKIIKTMGKSRANWSDDEDVNLIICHSAKVFLCNKRRLVAPTTVRDVMHRLCANRRKKPSVAYSRRALKLLKSDEYQQGNERYTYHLEGDKTLQKVFSKFRNKIVDCENIPDALIQLAFIYLVSYIASSYKKPFKNQQRILEEGNFIDYLTSEAIPKYLGDDDVKSNDILYYDPRNVDEVKVDVIKAIIHCSLGWKSDNSELPLMLYRAYQHYPDHLLKESITTMREQQIIAGKKFTSKHWNVKEGIHMAGNLIHNSFVYSFKQITKYPDYIYPEGYQMFMSIYRENNREREFLAETFEQGHGLGLIEIASEHDVIFSFKIPDDLLILDPKISDHSQLIQELAVRYKFMINQKKAQEFEDQQTPAKDLRENIESVEKAIEVIFEAQKKKSSNIKENDSKNLIFSENDDVQLIEVQKEDNSESTLQVKIKSEKDAKPAKTPELNKNNDDETTKALQEITTYLGNRQGENSLRISDLAYLLTKGLFPELDDDEERLEKLNKHFLIMYPSSTYIVPKSIVGTSWVEEVLTNGRCKGKEIEELIRIDCIVKNSYHDEEIANGMIDIGGDDEDIKLAFSVMNYIKQKGVFGALSSELKKEFSSQMHTLELHEIIIVLIKIGIIFRAGIRNMRFIHVTENEVWTVGLDDERPISELNLSSLGMRLKLMPWVRINGSLNLKVLHNWMHVIQSHCLSHPHIMLTALMKRFNFLKPVDIFSLLEYLQILNSIRLYTHGGGHTTTLFSNTNVLGKRPVNILDDFDTIFVETDKTAILKMGAFRYKGQTDISIPFEE